MGKSLVYRAEKMSPGDSILDTVDVDAHRRKRKFVSRPIAERAMRMFEPTPSLSRSTCSSGGSQAPPSPSSSRHFSPSSSLSGAVNMTERCI